MKKTWLLIAATLLTIGCGKKEGDGAGGDKADGPESIVVPDITVSTKPEDITKGEQVFAAKGCTACHKIGGGKLVGPDLQGVTARRSIKWIERQILKPEVMLQEDETAKALLKQYMTPMANQNVSPDAELPYILAYLKAHEK
jgi:mono/diheme cytochrome c family protein